MSVFQPTAVKCPQCDAKQFVDLLDTINVDRFAWLRDRILQRKLHRLSCPRCGADALIEKKLFYMDRGRNTFILIATPRSRPDYRKAPQVLNRLVAQIPVPLRGSRSRYTRTVFGLEEMREKLVAQDAGLDDRIVELMKGYILEDHPVLMRRPRLRIVLETVSSEAVHFTASYDHSTERFDIGIDRTIVSRVESNITKVRRSFAEVHQKDSIFAAPASSWISFNRWSSTNDAIALLQAFAEKARRQETIDTSSTDFGRMVRGLPRGSQLPTGAKRDLRDVRDALRAVTPPDERALDKLFEVRFAKDLEDEWGTNATAQDIPRIWDVLEALPPMNVEGNIKLRSILVNVGSGGGFYLWSGDIELGDRDIEQNPAGFDSTLRHEVGHAVMDQAMPLVQGWLTTRFGWQYFDPSNAASLNTWIAMMYPRWSQVQPHTQQQIRDAIKASLGPTQQWGPPPRYSLPPDHLWNQPDFGPRIALERSTTNWYDSNRDWYRVGTKAFFGNYWYAWPMAVNTDALDMINSFMPSAYAAMSHFEFFAELYALYFDPGNPARNQIPPDVMQWFATNIGRPPAPRPPAAPSQPTSASIPPPAVRASEARLGRVARNQRPRRTAT